MLDSEDLDVIRGLLGHIPRLAKDMGPAALLAYFEDTLSNVLQVSERRSLADDDLSRALEYVYSHEIGEQ